jgi:hypothetical protein
MANAGTVAGHVHLYILNSTLCWNSPQSRFADYGMARKKPTWTMQTSTPSVLKYKMYMKKLAT